MASSYLQFIHPDSVLGLYLLVRSGEGHGGRGHRSALVVIGNDGRAPWLDPTLSHLDSTGVYPSSGLAFSSAGLAVSTGRVRS